MGYSLWELRTRSAYTGFGHSCLANDAEDVSDLVRYLRTTTNTPTGKIVLMGSSTGTPSPPIPPSSLHLTPCPSQAPKPASYTPK